MEFNIDEKNRNLAVIITIAAMVILVAIMISLIFQFSTVENLAMGWILTTFYAVFAFWMVGDPIRTIEKPIEVIKEVPIQIPIENKTIEVVETPVEVPIQIPIENRVIEVVDRPVEVIKTIEVPVPRKKLNIPKFDYVGSTETRTFHKRNCRFGKLIKKKHKIQDNKKDFFRKKHFKACKVCMKK